MAVPKSHPRYESLMRRERLAEAYKAGMVAEAGMMAHGRGEAFDYLLGECTIPEAEEAERAAAALLLNADNPVISVNGNVAALCPEAAVELAKAIPAKLEVNLFYRTEERVRLIAKHLRDHGAVDVLGTEPDAAIPGLEHARGLCAREGIFSADTVLVPLEDGDRVQALRGMGKTVIVIDLNPLSRSARAANITIVDEVTRALPNIAGFVAGMRRGTVPDFDNSKNLRKAIDRICNSLFEIRCAYGEG